MPNLTITPSADNSLVISSPTDQVVNINIVSDENETLDLSVNPVGESAITLSVENQGVTNLTLSQDVVFGGSGDTSALQVQIDAINNIISQMNRLPSAATDTLSGSDTATSLTINVIQNDSDYEGSQHLSIANWTYGSTQKLPGESLSAAYGTVSISSAGLVTYTLDSRARALTSGQTVTESIAYTISDKNNATVSSNLVITINGTNNAPIVVADNAIIVKNKVASGNVLVNDSDPEGSALTVTGITINGSNYSIPASVNLSGVATITMQSNGNWTATPSTDYTGEIPLVTYSATDGTSTTSGTLFLAVAMGAVPALSNPVTTAKTGSVATYNVYSDTDLDAVPWGLLTAGHIVNIHYKATPYSRKFGIRGSGTYQNPIEVWGVTDASGNRPVLDFNGATTCASCNPGGVNNIFSDNIAYGESLAGIMIKRGPSDDYNYKPSYIRIANLELKGTTSGNSYTTMQGAQVTYGVAAGIYSQASRYVTIENNIITENGNGVFTMAKDGLLSQAAEFTVLRNNRIYGNGVSGSYYEHNVYMQCNQPLVEGNYFGQVRAGSLGSTYKTRSAKDVIRFNYFEGSARIIDLVHSEDQDVDGISKQLEYGTDYIYGNILVNDQALPNGGTYAGVHYGGDNLGEDETAAISGLTDKYRKQLYFFNNTYYVKATSGFRCTLFDISLQAVKVDCWDNSFIINVPTGFMVSWTEWAGTINLRGNNNIFSSVALIPSRNDANASLVTYNALGTITTTDPKPYNLSTYDFTPCTDSGLAGTNLGVPSGVPTSLVDYDLPVQLRGRTNGMLARTEVTTTGPLMYVNQAQQQPTGFTAYVPAGGGGGGGGGSSTITATSGDFLFNEANGTTFANNTDWAGSGVSSKSRYEVQNGALQALTGTGSYGEVIYYSGTSQSLQCSNAILEYPWSGNITLSTRTASGISGYSLSATPTSCMFYRAGVWQGSFSTPTGTGGTQNIRIIEEAGFVKCYVDATLLISYSESTPLTQGYPGISITASPESGLRIASWKDTA